MNTRETDHLAAIEWRDQAEAAAADARIWKAAYRSAEGECRWLRIHRNRHRQLWVGLGAVLGGLLTLGGVQLARWV